MLSKKKVKKRINNKNKDLTNKLLLVIFLILCVVVFILAIVMISKNSEYKKNKYDILLSMTEEELKNGFDIKVNMEDVSKNKSKEYRIKVTNYLGDNINKEVLKYKIVTSLSNKKSNIDIELYSNKENYELLKGNSEIDNLRLEKDKKEEIIYTLKLTQRNNPKDNDFVNVNIAEDIGKDK